MMRAVDDHMYPLQHLSLLPGDYAAQALPHLGGSVTFMLLAGIYDAGAALVGGSTWTQRVRHREQARKGGRSAGR